MALARKLAGAALIAVGILVALFFGALLGIADCPQRCQQEGERAPALALVACGFATIVVGGLVLRGRSWRGSVAAPMAGVGAAAVVIAGWYAASGAGLSGPVVWTGAPGVAALTLGVWLSRV